VHRACIGLRPTSLLGGAYNCKFCEAFAMCWAGGAAAERAAMRTSEAVTKLEAEAWEESTEITYGDRLRQVKLWGCNAGFEEEDVFPPGADASMPAVVAFGALEWGLRRWAPATIEGAAVAIGAWHANKEVENPLDSERGRRVVKAAKKRALRLGHKGRGAKAPVTKGLLALTESWLEYKARVDPRRAPLFWREQAWSTLGFHGLLRRSELGALRMRDVVLDKTRGRVKVFIHK
jgi:hypothetical protein